MLYPLSYEGLREAYPDASPPDRRCRPPRRGAADPSSARNPGIVVVTSPTTTPEGFCEFTATATSSQPERCHEPR